MSSRVHLIRPLLLALPLGLLMVVSALLVTLAGAHATDPWLRMCLKPAVVFIFFSAAVTLLAVFSLVRAQEERADAVALQTALGLLLHRNAGLEYLGEVMKEARARIDQGFGLPFLLPSEARP